MKFSVLMSIYAATRLDDLERCLESLAQQTLQPDQIVLVYDGPVDACVENWIENRARQMPLYCLKFPTNRGLGPALRDGLIACKHDLVARVDSDDWSVPERFEIQVDHLLNNPSISVIGGWLKEYYPGISGSVGMIRRTPLEQMTLKRNARRKNPLNHPTVMFRKYHVLASGNYESCPLFEDYLLWAKMLMRGYHLSNLPKVLVETEIDTDYFARRGGLYYIRQEIHLLSKLYTIGFFSRSRSIIFFLSRLPMRLIPKRLRQHSYKLMLRGPSP